VRSGSTGTKCSSFIAADKVFYVVAASARAPLLGCRSVPDLSKTNLFAAVLQPAYHIFRCMSIIAT
jgi:hypothetical protein